MALYRAPVTPEHPYTGGNHRLIVRRVDAYTITVPSAHPGPEAGATVTVDVNRAPDGAWLLRADGASDLTLPSATAPDDVRALAVALGCALARCAD